MTLGPEHLTGRERTLRPGNIVARESKINGETADRIGPRTGPEAPKFNRALRSLRARLNFQTLGRVRGPVSRPEDFVGLGRLNASGSFGPGVNLRLGRLVPGPVPRAAKITGPYGYGALGPGEMVRPSCQALGRVR